ncbi:SMP-30/gluconolactonase/LRE family protein [Balneola sp. MJW-20]|uniref:SMP-30/gluconolactonase/LRE family protein n=1 Tax=Gracilimonas aurantiaca TaxID=3234185 RepID=UPI0034660AAE
MRFYSLILIIFVFSQCVTAQHNGPEKIADGFIFTEGPLWFEGALIFSDIPANTIYRVIPGEDPEVFIRPSANSNGLAVDVSGHLLIAQHGARQMVRMEDNDTYTTLAATYNKKKLNSPNDIAVHPDGSIYFTDPPYGISPEEEELDFTGVYRIAPDGSLHLLEKGLYNPNGIAFSPGHDKLYISTSDQREVYIYEVNSHQLQNKRLFASQTEYEGASDGMVTDDDGNLYLAGPEGVWIYSPEGDLKEIINVPGQTSNVAWGAKKGKTLYVTSSDAVYLIEFN